MNDLISREAAMKAILGEYEDAHYPSWYGAKIMKLPSAQPERKTGVWEISDAYPHNVYCSVCHKRFAQTHWAVWQDGSLPRKYCPNCGAKMEGNDG